VSTLHDRIRGLIIRGEQATAIARLLGCGTDTVYREARRFRAGLPPGPEGGAPRGAVVKWDDARVGLLKELWCDNVSAGEIVKKFRAQGVEVSRSAIIGKAWRLGLPPRAQVNTSVARLTRVRKPSSFKPKRRPILEYGNPALRRLYLVEASQPPAEELFIPVAERKTVETLEDSSCRWPIGDPQHPDFHFCGRPKIAGLPYCDHHSRVAFQPPQTYRRAPPADRIPTYADAEKEDVACGS